MALLSIFTTSAGTAATAASVTGRPVRGYTGTGAGTVVVVATVVVGAAVVVGGSVRGTVVATVLGAAEVVVASDEAVSPPHATLATTRAARPSR